MRTSCCPGLLGRVVRVVLFTLPVLATLGGTALLVALPLTWLDGGTAVHPAHLLLGLVCGLIAWLFLSVFHLKRETLLLPFKDRAVFVERLTGQLRDLGYEPHGRLPDQLVY